MPHRNIHGAYHAPHVVQARGYVLHKQLIAARVDGCAAAARQYALRSRASGGRAGTATQQCLNVRGLLIVQLEALGHQRLQVGDLRTRFQRELFAGGEFVARRDPYHVSFLAHVQTLAAHDDVERLIPRHVLQPQRQVTGDRIAGDDIEACEISQHLQYRAHLDVLEIERKFFAGETGAHQAIRVFDDAFDFHDKAVIRLIRRVLPIARRCDDDTRVAPLRCGFHHLHGRGEIGHVVALDKVARQHGILKIHHHRAALPAHVDAHLAVRQIDHHTAFARVAAPEIDVAQAVRTRRRRRCLGEAPCCGAGCRGGSGGRATLQGDQQRFAVELRFIVQRARELHHHACTVTRLDDVNAPYVAVGDIGDIATQGIARVREVEYQARRVVDGKARRRSCERLF